MIGCDPDTSGVRNISMLKFGRLGIVTRKLGLILSMYVSVGSQWVC